MQCKQGFVGQILGLLALMALSIEAQGKCLPVRLSVEKAPIFEAADEAAEVGILSNETAGDLQICRIEGEWARVYLMPVYYWMRLKDLLLDERTRRIVSLELPPNGETPVKPEMCYEAATVPLRTPLFLADDRGVIADARILPRWTPLLACKVSGPWTEVVFEGREGFVETRNLVVSTAQRERSRGFDHAFACTVFYWKVRTTSKASVFRWSATGELEEETIPQDREVEVAHARGLWLWVGYGGKWGYVGLADVDVLPQVYERTRVADAPEDCGPRFKRAMARQEVRLYQSAQSSETVVSISPGHEFIVFERSEAGRFLASYLSYGGWVEVGGWESETGWTSPVEAEIPRGFQAATLVSAVDVQESLPWDWRFLVMVGPAASSRLKRLAGAADFAVSLRASDHTFFAFGISGLVSEDVAAFGPDFGPMFRVSIKNSAFFDVWLAGSVQRLDAGEVGLGLGGRAVLSLSMPLTRPYEVGLSYSCRGSWLAACSGPRPCLGANFWLIHAVQLSISARL